MRNVGGQVELIAEDGKYSAREIANIIGVKRPTVWKHLRRLRRLGLEFKVPRYGKTTGNYS